MLSSVRVLAACAVALTALGTAPPAVPAGGTAGLEVSSEPLQLGTLVKSSFRVSGDVTVSVESAVFPRDRVSIRVIDYPLGGPPGAMVARSVVEHVLAALNGGYFTARGLPDGLVVIDGAVRSPAVAHLSGLVGSTRDGESIIGWLDGIDRRTLAYALQAGPFIVDPGGTAGIRRDSGERARRSIVIESDHAIAVAVTSACGLYDLMNALLLEPQAFGVDRVDRALNLDGGPSSGLAVRLPSGKVEQVPERTRIRTVLTVIERTR